MSIRENLAAVEQRIAAACARAKRNRSEVTLIAVSKTFPAAMVDEAIAAGIAEIGENRVQEAREKKPAVQRSARWHLVGHLQSNKAKDAVGLFEMIQTVDSVNLAEKIARAAEGAGKTQDVLLQVNIGDEPQKSGATSAELEALARDVRRIGALRVRGLMALPPVSSLEEMRNHFKQLRSMRDALGLEELSMGMSDDFEMAIEEGSTMVRIGRAIFGSRG
ncbi:MAG: YggS family pyridoxal phosphate-dependent enzyme [Acidobacteria bacterium]|nr:MAG: YggS family pyridoxal phosphate-dependent enzyme [Acidobacteriota bacterium]